MMRDHREALTDILEDIFPEDAFDDSAYETARRVLQYWVEYSKVHRMEDDLPFNLTTFPTPANNLVVVTNIEFSSICAHHLLPFYGRVHVGYLPNELAIGLSKIPRLVDMWAAQPQMQERLTDCIATDLKHRLQAQGVAVIIEARHTCMACRGVRKHNGAMITSTMMGTFLSNPAAKQEFMEIIARERV